MCAKVISTTSAGKLVASAAQSRKVAPRLQGGYAHNLEAVDAAERRTTGFSGYGAFWATDRATVGRGPIWTDPDRWTLVLSEVCCDDDVYMFGAARDV